ncbi:pre-B-cell leukemia transcription factor-interacting protein 1 isoform X2 [Latimeria chalumnae]|uniref:pre-B-cell leukemia transcription factor-interacting protein 1 isoform X2 n=1 Tax=Latimeria chalumnae TaxID=7897 RepID=UPI0006D930AF|nr:PREDICTED: pre-B-cell leukemia transcription factor-interacting protein 1 isoform X2 [Latimeria chalumnae]|eukprot:XP_014348389.1 PREDICTED: pre-B-cell leukemia transcription factor-interacting protein 1 isoform X2 [Latimeria chalumnae]
MSANSSSSDSNSSWTVVSQEAPSVETLGPVRDGISTPPEDVKQPAVPFETAVKEPNVESSSVSEGKTPESEEVLEQDTAPVTVEGDVGVKSVASPETHLSETVEIPPEEEAPSNDSDLGAVLSKKYSSLTHKAEDDVEEPGTSGSEGSAEGLRRRQVGGKLHPTADFVERGEEEQDGDQNLGITLNKCIVAALLLLGIGLAFFSGVVFPAEDGPEEDLETRNVKEVQQPQIQDYLAESEDWLNQYTESLQGDPETLPSMTALLDKLAKENQEIRLMQAELQAQKNDLESLLRMSEGEKISADSNQQNLLEENLHLEESLRQEEAALASLQGELEMLREKVKSLEETGLETESFVAENQKLKEELSLEKQQVENFLTQKESLVAESQMLWQELDKQKGLVLSMRQELENLIRQVPPLQEGIETQEVKDGLVEMEKQLAMELEYSEIWENFNGESNEQTKETPEESKYITEEKHIAGEVSIPVDEPTESEQQTVGDLPKLPASHIQDTTKSIFLGSKNSTGKRKDLKDWKDWKRKKHEHLEKTKEGGKRDVKYDHQKEHKNEDWVSKKYEDWKEKNKEWRARKEEWKSHEEKHRKFESWKDKQKEDYHNRKEHGEYRFHQYGPQRNSEDQHYEKYTGGPHPLKEHEQSRDQKYYKEAEKYQKKKLPEMSTEPKDRESGHRHHDHNKFWKKTQDHQYRVPKGCSGVSDCAHKEGMGLYNVALQPVEKQELHRLIQDYLQKIDGSKYMAELESLLASFFEGGVFVHDRMLFRDFVDDLDDYLEDIVERDQGNDDSIEDFEDHILKHFFGEAAVENRPPPKERDYTKHKQDNIFKPPYEHKEWPRNFMKEQRHRKEEDQSDKKKK